MHAVYSCATSYIYIYIYDIIVFDDQNASSISYTIWKLGKVAPQLIAPSHGAFSALLDGLSRNISLIGTLLLLHLRWESYVSVS